MYSSSDFERLFVRYQCEAVPNGISIQKFCEMNKVPYNLFDKWYKDTHRKIVPVQVTGIPEPEPVEVPVQKQSLPEKNADVRILVDIRVNNGLQIRQSGLSYERLRNLVEKLEALC